MIKITTSVLDPRAIEAVVADPGCGAVLTFHGVTRNHFDGRRVTGLSYEAYPEMAEAKMAEIRDEIAEKWPGARVAMVHRIGELDIGEGSVVIAVSTPHRAACYEASRYAIEELKKRVPVWKKEHYADGDADWKANKS